MAVIGWLCLLTAMGYASIIYILIAFNGLGEYNIGGVPNSLLLKIGIIISGGVVGWLWYALFSIAPFTVTIS